MILNEFGTIAYNEWKKLPERFPNVELDIFQVMPNHMHGIIVLNDVGTGHAPAHDNASNPYGGRGKPLRLETSWTHINHWFQMNAWIFTKWQ